MKHSHRFFENTDCEYYPCHSGVSRINCMFCFCPLYAKAPCPGNPSYLKVDGKEIKDCTGCVFPHLPQNYEKIMDALV